MRLRQNIRTEKQCARLYILKLKLIYLIKRLFLHKRIKMALYKYTFIHNCSILRKPELQIINNAI